MYRGFSWKVIMLDWFSGPGMMGCDPGMFPHHSVNGGTADRVFVQVAYDFDYVAEDGSQVIMRENEILLLINKTNHDWWQVRHIPSLVAILHWGEQTHIPRMICSHDWPFAVPLPAQSWSGHKPHLFCTQINVIAFSFSLSLPKDVQQSKIEHWFDMYRSVRWHQPRTTTDQPQSAKTQLSLSLQSINITSITTTTTRKKELQFITTWL